MEKKYPEVTMFGRLNAYEMYFRHVENLKISDVECNAAKPDMRPLLRLEKVNGSTVSNILGDVQHEAPLVKTVNSSGVLFSNLQPVSSCAALVELAGSATKNIRLTGSDLSNARQAFTLSDGVVKGSMKLLNNFE